MIVNYFMQLDENDIKQALAEVYLVSKDDVEFYTSAENYSFKANISLDNVLKSDLTPIVGTLNSGKQLDIIKCKLEQYKAKLQGMKLNDDGSAYKEAFNKGLEVATMLLEETFGIESEG